MPPGFPADDRAAAPSPSRRQLILPAAGAGLLIACGAALFRPGGETHTVSHVVRAIREIALSGNAPDAPRDAGRLGPWRIAAERVDPQTGRLVNFRLRSGPMMIAARSAGIQVDPRADTFGFEMWHVAILRVPERSREPGEGARSGAAAGPEEASVQEIDHYVLGPAPYGVDIVPDGAAAYAEPAPDGSGDTPNPSPLAGAH